MGENVLIIGGGAAGLRAAQMLVHSGVGVTLLEARDRLGGRMFTTVAQPGDVAVELGAEFIHGEQNAAWDAVHAAKLRTHRVPDKHWRLEKGKMVECTGFWEQFGQVTDRINTAAPDQDLQSFLDQGWSLAAGAKRALKEYVEGFHAAPANRMSIHALAKAEAAAERDQATQSFRIARGYSALVDWLAADLKPPRCSVHLKTAVEEVHWAPGRVQIVTQPMTGQHRFEGARALVTLPLGVLQAVGPGSVVFEPVLTSKERAIRGLGMGSVTKVTLVFRSRFWPVDNFGFIHANDRWLPTWWSDPRAPILTGWAGGPRAMHLSPQSAETIIGQAIDTLARLFQREPERLRDELIIGFHHDWNQDPYSRGAYSYTPVRMANMTQRLAAPVANTLFFAGEATAPDGEQGTVHAALASGERAAQEILASVSGSRLPPVPNELQAAA